MSIKEKKYLREFNPTDRCLLMKNGKLLISIYCHFCLQRLKKEPEITESIIPLEAFERKVEPQVSHFKRVILVNGILTPVV